MEEPNSTMTTDLKALIHTVISNYEIGLTFNAHDFITKFKGLYPQVYADYEERSSVQTINSRIAWILSKYDDELGVMKVGFDADERVSTWKRIR